MFTKIMRSKARRHAKRKDRRLIFESLEHRQLLAGDISLADPETYSGGAAGARIIAADLDADGDFDLIASNYFNKHGDFGDSGVVLLNQGTGTFADPVPYGISGYSLATGDFDGDGHLDLAVGFRQGRLNVEEMTVDAAERIGVSVLKGKGDGTFGDPTRYISGGVGVTAGDFDGDGDLDLAAANQVRKEVHVLLGKADGTFADSTAFPTGKGAASMTSGDLDGDGDLDLVTANYDSNNISVLLNDGSGSFEKIADYPVPDITHYSGGSSTLTAADLDGDGDLDLAVSHSGYVADDVSVLLGDGKGSFARPVSYSVALDTDRKSPWLVTINAIDLDRDGDLDLAVSDSPNDAIKLLVNQGDGVFNLQQDVYRAGLQVLSHVFADVDSDGDLDIAAINDAGCPRCQPGISVLINQSQSPPQPGDTNRDGVFNQLDIIRVLQAGKYLTSQPAAFGEGDWNGDGVFDQLDLIHALASGGYLQD